MRLSVDTKPLCQGTDPEAWFPEPTAGHSKFSGEHGQEIVYNTLVALEACARCSLQSKCLQFAVDQKEMYGIWGGTFPHERAEAVDMPEHQSMIGAKYYIKLRLEVLKKNARLKCPPIPQPKTDFIPIKDFLPVPRPFALYSDSEFQDEEPLNQ